MKTAIAFGVFDGLHEGHRAVLEATKGYKRIAVTFINLPKLGNDQNGLLMTPSDREAALKSLGMDEVVCLDLEKIKDMLPEEFLDYIRQRFDVALFACGENFRFGKAAKGDIKLLKSYCQANGIKLSVIKTKSADGRAISSSYIRFLVKSGEIEKANDYLSRPFCFTSRVERGDMRGRELGFPTINQEMPEGMILPKSGVYASTASFDGKTVKSVTNIGIRPTFLIDHIAAETHLIGYNGDLYGKEITVCLYKFLRNEQKFETKEQLINAIKKDISEVQK